MSEQQTMNSNSFKPRKYDVIVVGAALAGVISAALMAKRGYKVALVEQLDYVGGRVGGTQCNGYWFNWGHRDGHGYGDGGWIFHKGAIAAREVRKLRAKEISHLRAVAAGAPEQTVDGAVDADERIDAMRRLRAIAPQLEKLAPRDRETLLLYAWGDLTYEQIAETLRVPVGTVRSRLNRVRRKLTAVRPGPGDMAAYTMGEGA